MKILVEFDFSEDWEKYCPDNEQKIHDIIDPQIDGVEYRIISTTTNVHGEEIIKIV